ncbi:MAG TPA: DctP family TRAP transporter solute-binding subunit [Burkholderiaceae bacterium]|nr:DctP family TRAP transporter solute-binding subunit [Burkholderiaceae bacterium]
MRRRHMLAALAAPLLIRPVRAKPVTRIVFGLAESADTLRGRAVERFAGLVHERSGGRVRVDIQAYGQAGKEREEIEPLQLGAVDMLAPPLAKLGLVGLTDMALFDLPFLFDDFAAVSRVTEGPLGRQMLGRFSTKGFVGLAYWHGGFKQMSARRPLRRVADYSGLKMWTAPSQVLDAQMRALGASSVPMPPADVFEGLRSGLVDGAEMPLTDFESSHMHDVQSHVSLSGHGYHGFAVVANERFWDGLPAEQRVVVQTALQEATAFGNDLAQQAHEAALAALRRAGRTHVLALTAPEKHTLRLTLLPVHRQMEGRIGADLLRRAYRVAGFEPSLA